MQPYHLYNLYALLRTQRKPSEHVKEIQQQKLQKLVHHAYQHVPYYRNLFNSLKIHPEDINTAEDLRMVPVTSAMRFPGVIYPVRLFNRKIFSPDSEADFIQLL